MNNEIRERLEDAFLNSAPVRWKLRGMIQEWLADGLEAALKEEGLSIVMLDCSKDEPAGDPSRLGLGPDAHWPWVDKP